MSKNAAQRKPSIEDHFDRLHRESHGISILWEKGAPRSRWLKLSPGDSSIPGILRQQVGQADRFISVNEFYAWRLVRHLKSLRSCYVDIDGCTDLELALDVLASEQLPAPSFVVYSGRGLHLYWALEPVPAQALPVWQAIQDRLVEALAPIGADPVAKDCTRVLRLVGSVNSKVNEEVRGLVLNEWQWTLHTLSDEVLGHRPERQPKPAKVRSIDAERAARTAANIGIYKRWHLVYQDLIQISDWHFLGGVPEGHRNNWLFLASVALSWFVPHSRLTDEIEKSARIWTPDLTITEVRRGMSTVIDRAEAAAKGETIEWSGQQFDPRYRFKRATLFDWMRSIIAPELLPRLRAIIPDEVKAEHHAEAKRKHEATRDRVAEGRYESNERGRKVQADSEAQAKPWEALGMSRASYYRQKAAGTLPVTA